MLVALDLPVMCIGFLLFAWHHLAVARNNVKFLIISLNDIDCVYHRQSVYLRCLKVTDTAGLSFLLLRMRVFTSASEWFQQSAASC